MLLCKVALSFLGLVCGHLSQWGYVTKVWFSIYTYVGDIEANEMLELSIFWVYKRNVVNREGVDVVGSCKLNFVRLWRNDLVALWGEVNLMALCKIATNISKL
jgi:hypothetical protein